ncbi:MAG TPA: protein kinase, partial [Kofleriaceae bacterium]|nr:protein kinase [Kofleriaceae bacterium]
PQSSSGAELSRGTAVGRYVVLGRLGAGAMGVVYAAYDPELDRKVALKLLRSSDDRSIAPEEAQSRLLREAQAIAQQSHPNVISVYDVGTYKSEVYIAMELVEGHTLSRWLRMLRRPWRDILDKFLEAGEALMAAHGSGLVHRDFKPDNVLVGDDDRVRVMDFGLARSLFYDLPSSGEVTEEAFRVSIAGVSELNRTLTRTGAVLGTPRYMAPEQFLGGEADARSDQFSFCVALYEAVYRQHPFEGNTAKALVESSDVRPLPPPAKHDVPPWLHRAILRGLEREPSRRYPSMRTLVQAITPPRVKPTRAWIAPLAILGILVVGLTGYGWKKRNDTQRAIDQARQNQLDAESNRAIAESLRAELELIRRERNELVAIREQLVDQLGSSLDAVGRVRELERQIVEKDLHIDQLTKRLDDRPAATPPITYGPRDSAIRNALAPAMNDIKACFTEWRERQPAKSIAVVVRFTIDPAGRVVEADMLGSPDKVLRLCITDIISEVAYPTSNGIAVVQYDFDTTPTRFDHSSRVVERRAPAPGGLP